MKTPDSYLRGEKALDALTQEKRNLCPQIIHRMLVRLMGTAEDLRIAGNEDEQLLEAIGTLKRAVDAMGHVSGEGAFLALVDMADRDTLVKSK